MRFLHLTPFYPAHIAAFYVQHPALAQQTYAVQHTAILTDGFNWGNYLYQNLRQYGYETRQHITNAALMQQQWAKEHGVTYGGDWELAIALAQVKDFQPDILYTNLSPDFVKAARDSVPSLKLVIGWAGEPIVDARRFHNHDLVLTCVKENISFYRSAGLKSDLLHHAFYPAILDKIDAPAKTIDVGFIGNMLYGDYIHTQRAQLFARLLDDIDIVLYGSVDQIDVSPDNDRSPRGLTRRSYFATLARLHRMGLDGLVKTVPRGDFVLRQEQKRSYKPVFDRLAHAANPPLFGISMYQQLANFKICMNAHAWSAYASNMRLYEATGVGTCLLTDWKRDIHELFEPDVEVVTYRSAEEAVEKARYLLAHDDEREAIALAGQRRTLRDHTLGIRTSQLDSLMRRYIIV